MAESALPKRYDQIDIFRGIAIALMIAEGNRAKSDLPKFLCNFIHGPWFGSTIADIVFPFFLFISGVSLQISFARHVERGGDFSGFARRALWRSAKLFVIGVGLASLAKGRPVLGLGTLQCIAAASVLALPSVLLSARAAFLVPIFIGLGHSAFIILFRPAGVPWSLRWDEGRTIAEAIDTIILGQPRGMEGISALVMAAATMIFGTFVSKVLYCQKSSPLPQQEQESSRSAVSGLALSACVLVLTGLLFHLSPESPLWIPIVPDLFSLSYAVFSCGLALLLLIFLDWICRINPSIALLRPLRTLGLNALGLFIFVKFLNVFLLNGPNFGSREAPFTLKQIILNYLTQTASPGAASICYTLGVLFLGWCFCHFLKRRAIILKL